MLMPSIFSNDFMDDFFSVPRVTGFGHSYDNNFSRMMTTDVKENENGYNANLAPNGFINISSNEIIEVIIKFLCLVITDNFSSNILENK